MSSTSFYLVLFFSGDVGLKKLLNKTELVIMMLDLFVSQVFKIDSLYMKRIMSVY